MASNALLKSASSLERAQLGEMIWLGRQGEVMGAAAMRRLRTRMWVRAGALWGGIAVLYGWILGPLGVAVAAGGFGMAVVWGSRRSRPYRAALALMAEGRRDEAYEAFTDLSRRGATRQWRPVVELCLAQLEWMRGRHPEALAGLDALLPRLRARPLEDGHLWLALFYRAGLLAVLGRLDEARSVARELDDAPRGEFFEMQRQGLLLSLAFHADRPEDLPTDEVLYDWARAALGRTRFGSVCVLCAWAFERRGDTEMAAHLLKEAPDRLTGSFLAETHPRLHAYLQARQSAGA